MQNKRALLSASRQPSSLVQEPGSRPAEFSVAAARRAATLFSAHYDVIRPLTRLPEAGVVNSWLYTYGLFTGGKGGRWEGEVIEMHKLTTAPIHDSSCVYAQ